MPPSALRPTPRTYAELRRAVQAAMIQGQQAVDLARVRTYHETGRLIHEHVLLFKERADYGSKTIPSLAADLDVDRSVLLRCVQFFRAFPIVAPWRHLSWAHFRVLLPVTDPAQRRALATEADRNEWSVVQLEDRIRALAPPPAADADPLAGSTPPAKPLLPQRGTPGTYRIISMAGTLVVDLGFACYLELTAEQAEDLKADALVRLDSLGRIAAADNVTRADLFTYPANLIKAVDGDTLWVKVYLRPRQWVKLKLRLRGLDCPELGTPEGRAAKRFVEALLDRAIGIVIHTTKPDKYDRYLADVFLAGVADPSVPVSAGEDVFLNQALLAAGHAVRKDAWQFRDWEPDLLA